MVRRVHVHRQLGHGLGWLRDLQSRLSSEEDEDDEEPPVPPGLGALDAAHRALAEFMEIDPDLLAVAAEASEPLVPHGEGQGARLAFELHQRVCAGLAPGVSLRSDSGSSISSKSRRSGEGPSRERPSGRAIWTGWRVRRRTCGRWWGSWSPPPSPRPRRLGL
jgi:hypothetical protein